MKFAYLLACRCTRMDLWRTRRLFTSTCSKRCVEFPPDPTETCCSCREYVTSTPLSAQYFSVFCVILYALLLLSAHFHKDLACGTLFQSSCVMLTSATDCSELPTTAEETPFFGKHEHGALWLLICGAIEKHLLTYFCVIFMLCDFSLLSISLFSEWFFMLSDSSVLYISLCFEWFSMLCDFSMLTISVCYLEQFVVSSWSRVDTDTLCRHIADS